MIHITQLININDDCECLFDEFESIAIPIIRKHNGELLLGIRPDTHARIDGSIDTPYEIHIVSFLSEQGFVNFSKDDERKRFLHLKEKSIKHTVLYKGTIL